MKGYIIRLLHWNQLKSKRFLSNFILLFMTYWKRKRITCKKWNKRTNERNAWDWISFLNLLFVFRAKSWWIGTINALKSDWIYFQRKSKKEKPLSPPLLFFFSSSSSFSWAIFLAPSLVLNLRKSMANTKVKRKKPFLAFSIVFISFFFRLPTKILILEGRVTQFKVADSVEL